MRAYARSVDWRRLWGRRQHALHFSDANAGSDPDAGPATTRATLSNSVVRFGYAILKPKFAGAIG